MTNKNKLNLLLLFIIVMQHYKHLQHFIDIKLRSPHYFFIVLTFNYSTNIEN